VYATLLQFFQYLFILTPVVANKYVCPSGLDSDPNRVQKHRHKKSIPQSPTHFDKALEQYDQKPQGSDNSTSDGGSPNSSANSTPRISPATSNGGCCSKGKSGDLPKTERSEVAACASGCGKPVVNIPDRTREQTSLAKSLEALESSGCCAASKPLRRPLDTLKSPHDDTRSFRNAPQDLQQQRPPSGSCCGGPQNHQYSQMNNGQNGFQNMVSMDQLSQPLTFSTGLSQNGHDSSANMGLSYASGFSHGSSNIPLPYGFTTTIYNHLSPSYQQSQSADMDLHRRSSIASDQTYNHSCNCGDTCSCFGCADHPKNSTMTEYVRLMHQFQTTGSFGTMPPPNYDMPGYSNHGGLAVNGLQNAQLNHHIPTNHFSHLGSPYLSNGNGLGGAPSAQSNSHALWGANSSHGHTSAMQARDNSYPSGLGSHEKQQLSLKVEQMATQPSPDSADSPDDLQGEEAQTLSPSRYLAGEVVLPGCTDASGTCLCGDGCACIGCIVHDGHQGGEFGTAQQEDFPTIFSPQTMGHGINHAGYMNSQWPGAY